MRSPLDTSKMVTYKRKGDDSGTRFRSMADAKIPDWADDIRPLNPKIADVYVTVKARVHYWDDRSFEDVVDQCEDNIRYTIDTHLCECMEYHDIEVELDKGIDVL